MIRKFSNLKTNHQLFFSILVFFGIVSLWRGIWGLLDTYLFPNNLSVSFILSTVLGMIIIAVTHYSVDKLS